MTNPNDDLIKTIVRDYLKEPKNKQEEKPPGVGEGLAMGFMALGDALGGSWGGKTNYLGSYLKMKQDRKKIQQKKRPLWETLTLIDKVKTIQDKKRKETVANQVLEENIPDSPTTQEFHKKNKDKPTYIKTSKYLKKMGVDPTTLSKTDFKKHEETVMDPKQVAIGKRYPNYNKALLDAQKGVAPNVNFLNELPPALSEKITNAYEKAKERISKSTTQATTRADKKTERVEKEKQRRAEKFADKIRAEKGDFENFRDMESAKNQIQKGLFSSLYNQLGPKMALNFSINDLRSRQGKTYYVNPENNEETEVELPIFQGFLNKVIEKMGGDFLKQKFQSKTIGASSFSQGFQSILNARARAVSGAAVTENELNRLLKEFGSGKFIMASQIISKLQDMFRTNERTLASTQNNLTRVFKESATAYFNDPNTVSIERFKQRYSPESDKDFYGNIGRIMDNQDHLYQTNKQGRKISPSFIMRKIRERNLKPEKIKNLLREIYRIK